MTKGAKMKGVAAMEAMIADAAGTVATMTTFAALPFCKATADVARMEWL